VDVYDPFPGHVADCTYSFVLTVGSNIHPNTLGYSVIAAQIDASVVSEPSSILLVSSGAAFLMVFARRRLGGRRPDPTGGR
jgi:hypothetical protein